MAAVLLVLLEVDDVDVLVDVVVVDPGRDASDTLRLRWRSGVSASK